MLGFEFVKPTLQWYGDKLTRWVNDRVHSGMHAAGAGIVKRAKQLAPVRTGQLRDGIGYIYRPQDRTLIVEAKAPHSVFVEFGTYKMAPRPFLRPAMKEAGHLFFAQQVAMGFPNTPKLKSGPHPVMEHIRPKIKAANWKYTRKAVRRAPVLMHGQKFKSTKLHNWAKPAPQAKVIKPSAVKKPRKPKP